MNPHIYLIQNGSKPKVGRILWIVEDRLLGHWQIMVQVGNLAGWIRYEVPALPDIVHPRRPVVMIGHDIFPIR